MIRKVLTLTLLFACAPLIAQRAVSETRQELWKYPCDVFMESACLHLPNGMSMTYEVPVDFGIYRFKTKDGELLSAYSGYAPQTPEGTPSLNLDSPNFRIRGYIAEKEGKTRLDIVFVPKKKDQPTMHVFGTFGNEQRAALATLIDGLRPCRRPSREEMNCPAESAWGKAMAEWVIASGTAR